MCRLIYKQYDEFEDDIYTHKKGSIIQSILGYTMVNLLCEGREYLCILHDLSTKRWQKTKFRLHSSNLVPVNSLTKFSILYHNISDGVLVLLW